MHIGYGQGRITSMAYNTYTTTAAFDDFLQSPTTTILPFDYHLPHSKSVFIKNDGGREKRKTTQVRQSKGVHMLPILTRLLSSREFWYEIRELQDYQYPGTFNAPDPQRLGYAPNITELKFYTKDDEHFLFNDIQFGKGQLRQPRKVSLMVDGKREDVFYRIAPCGGVKHCPVEDCSYVVSTRDRRACPQHADSALSVVKECSVEFVYVWPVNGSDSRRWLSGITRTGDLSPANLHSHPLPAPTKIPSKVVNDIKEAVKLDPSLKTHEIVTGEYRMMCEMKCNIVLQKCGF